MKSLTPDGLLGTPNGHIDTLEPLQVGLAVPRSWRAAPTDLSAARVDPPHMLRSLSSHGARESAIGHVRSQMKDDATASTSDSGLHYRRRTHLAALLLLVCGWGFSGWQRASESVEILIRSDALWVLGVTFLVLFGVSVAAGGILVRSLESRSRGNHLLAALVPCLAASAFLFFIGVPALELLQGLGNRGSASIDLWHHIGGTVFLAVFVVALYGPEQFFWRDVPRRWRVALLLLLAGPPTFVLLPVGLSGPFWDVLRSFVFGIVLVSLACWLVEVSRTAMETDRGLRPGALGAAELEPTSAYIRDDDQVRLVGVALSGGGYRASLFALGALMYLHDACIQPGTTRRRIGAVTSVSGGSVTNAALGHGVLLGEDGRDQFDHVAQILVRHVDREGSMFAGLAVLYYLVLLPVTGLGLLTLTWLGLSHLTWAVLWRSAAIPLAVGVVVVGGMGLIVVADSVKPHYLGPILSLIGLVIALGGTVAWLQFVLSTPDWRLALSWIATAVLAVGAAAVVWTLRGTLIQHTFQHLLDRIATLSGLADLRTRPHHVFCTTEIQFDETAYFAGDAIRAKSFRSAAPGSLPTAMAVRASAALPGAFPPVIVRGITGKTRGGTSVRSAPQWLDADHMVLVDGGVRDNLGVDWFTEMPGLVDELLVVSAAANRRPPRAITKLPGVSEARALLNLTNIPYNTRERNRRRAVTSLLFNNSGDAAIGGALCHIEDSPFDLAAKIRAHSEKWATPVRVEEATSVADWERDELLMLEHLRQWAAGEPEALAARATAVIHYLAAVERTLPDPPGITMQDQAAISAATVTTTRRLGGGPRLGASDAEIAWWKRAELSAAVRTTLGRIPPPVAMNLLIHGYYLAMANLHVLLDWPLLNDLDSARLEAMFAGIAAPPSVTARQDDRLQAARARLQNRPLRATYSALVFAPVAVTVRDLGEFRLKTAVVVMAADPERTPELLGLWLVPAPSRDHYRSNWMEAEAEYEAMLDDFWHELIADLARRGVQRLPVFCRDVPPAHRLRNNFHGFDEAVAEAFPGAMVVPRINSITDTVVSSIFPEPELISDISGVVRAPGADEACTRLEQLYQRWNQKYPDVSQQLRQSWEPLMRFVALPEMTRKSILDAHDDFEIAQKSIRHSMLTRGAFSSDLAAISFLQQSLHRFDGPARRESKWHHFRHFNLTKNNRKR
jgi:transposase-like protein